MAFPNGATTITVSINRPIPAGGAGNSGQIVFTPSTVLVDATHQAIYSGSGAAVLDTNGTANIRLLTTDAAGVIPTGWRWQVDEQLPGARRTYCIDLPSTLGTTVDLSALSPVSAPESTGQSLPPTGPAGGALTGAFPNPQLSAATIASFDPVGAATAAQAAAQTYADGNKLAKSANLSDVADPATARSNLGLGNSVTRNVGTTAGTVAAGDDSRLSDARTPTAHAATHGSGGSDPVTPAAIGALPASGGAVAGRLTIDRFGAPAGYPLGSTGAVESLSVPSSYTGGDDDGTGTDSTGRINLYSYQRANFNSFGENIRNFAMRSDAKTMQAFYIPVDSTKKGGYDPATRDPKASGVSWKPVVWQGAHYEANDHASIHGHWELEIADLSGALQGRLEIPFIDQVTDATKPLDQAAIGVAYTNIRTNLADFSVRAQNMTAGPYSGQNTALRVGGNNTVNKDVALSISSDMGTSGRRWILRANTTTESSTAAGTDFQILRYDNSGSQIATALGIERSTGNITLGASPGGQSSRMTAVWGTSGNHGYSAIPSASPGSAAAFDAQLTATTDRAYQAALPADANRRWVVFTDGKTEWGDGTASRDTNLYRSNPAVLKTDGALQATTSIRLNTTSLGSGVGVLAMANATTVPAGTPSGGGVLYVEAGALKYKGSSGTVTVIAPA